jgi:hypothetical protein
MNELINIAERMLAKMLEGKSINPYEYRATLAEAIEFAKEDMEMTMASLLRKG